MDVDFKLTVLTVELMLQCCVRLSPSVVCHSSRVAIGTALRRVRGIMRPNFANYA